MAKSKNLEATQILKSLEIKHLKALNDIKNNDELYRGLADVLTYIFGADNDKILRLAGGVSSMDDLIKNSNDQSFYRGRISALTLLNALLIRANDEIITREAKDK